jgi:hypothetical protein
MDQILRARPVNVQFRHRGFCVPPCYELYKPDVSADLAKKLAETYNLKSTGLVVNQNSASTQYLSFRYILADEPFRYLDAAIGIDQTEIAFANPATMSELITEISRVWNIVTKTQPVIRNNYFEATLHCQTESSAKVFLNELVDTQTQGGLDVSKGFSVTTKAEKAEAKARIGLEVSDLVSDGLYVMFAFVSKEIVQNSTGFDKLFYAVLNTYRSLQRLARIELVEPT